LIIIVNWVLFVLFDYDSKSGNIVLFDYNSKLGNICPFWLW